MTKRFITDRFREPTLITHDSNVVSISYGDLMDTVSDDHYPYGAIKVSYEFESKKGNKLFIGETAHSDAARWLNDAIGYPNPFAYDVHMVLR
jgi:hypothetical protein